jgi:hypothetical protein
VYCTVTKNIRHDEKLLLDIKKGIGLKICLMGLYSPMSSCPYSAGLDHNFNHHPWNTKS